MASLFCPQGPTLPQFSTLLIKGTYPPSAPIHLCVSHLKASSRAQGRALFLTPNREALAAALEDYGDGWMSAHCMTGAYAALFSRIDMLYAPSSHRNQETSADHRFTQLPSNGKALASSAFAVQTTGKRYRQATQHCYAFSCTLYHSSPRAVVLLSRFGCTVTTCAGGTHAIPAAYYGCLISVILLVCVWRGYTCRAL